MHISQLAINKRVSRKKGNKKKGGGGRKLRKIELPLPTLPNSWLISPLSILPQHAGTFFLALLEHIHIYGDPVYRSKSHSKLHHFEIG
ncbi:hypothetical protein GHT06_017777 [Daphnia sinensis]|uniref:Uncharacterized protein n=1 Tax=Daphnia sinensis TaxID=1820382 RepID=A0AAD5KMS1_9CRUS|nr:hypothetical protein GHT06_017777 [Daphnia sinensis]